MQRVLLVAGLFLGATLASVLGPVPVGGALPAAACPVASMTGFAQDDADSGRDAGDTRAGAVPLQAEGWSWANLDPPFDYGFQDLQDWFTLDVPEGARELTVKVVFLPNFYYGDDAVPLFYFLDIYEAGNPIPVHETISYLPPTTFEHGGGERLWFHVYMAPVSIIPACAPVAGGGAPDTGALPGDIGAYGVLADCAPDCATA